MRKNKNKKNFATSGDAIANNNATENSNKNKIGGPKGNYLPCQYCGKKGHSHFKC